MNTLLLFVKGDGGDGLPGPPGKQGEPGDRVGKNSHLEE